MAPTFTSFAATPGTVVVDGTNPSRVLSPDLPQLQVLNPVVATVPVQVVDPLVRFKEPAQRPLHHEPVLTDRTFVGMRMGRGVDHHVAPSRPASTSGQVPPSHHHVGRGRCRAGLAKRSTVVADHESVGPPSPLTVPLAGLSGDVRSLPASALAVPGSGFYVIRGVRPRWSSPSLSSHLPRIGGH